MELLKALDKAEPIPELCLKRIGIIPDDIEPAALQRAFRSERADNDLPARFYGRRNSSDVCPAVLRRSKKMEDGAIVPHIKSTFRRACFSQIGANPVD